MLSLDLKHAVNDTADNFTTKLFQLMMKSDASNLRKLSSAYPVEGAMINIYRSGCPYTDEAHFNPDFEMIEIMAKEAKEAKEA